MSTLKSWFNSLRGTDEPPEPQPQFVRNLSAPVTASGLNPAPISREFYYASYGSPTASGLPPTSNPSSKPCLTSHNPLTLTGIATIGYNEGSCVWLSDLNLAQAIIDAFFANFDYDYREHKTGVQFKITVEVIDP
jgi:hypothetical protein